MREKESFSNILPEYGRRKLLMFADSFRELASTFKEADKPVEVETTVNQLTDNNYDQAIRANYDEPYDLRASLKNSGDHADEASRINIGDMFAPVSDKRKDLIWQRRLQENKGIMVDNLREMAQIMTRVAEESRRHTPMGERRYKQIAHALKELHINVKDIYMLENEEGYTELSLVLRNVKVGSTISAEEIGDVISVLINNRMTPSPNNPFFIGQEWQTFYYVEAARFHVLTGVAKAIKENEKISGDNFSIFEPEPGNMTIILSDGMGSGDKACRDSSIIVELMEKFLSAGFTKEIAIQMINSVLLVGCDMGNMSTLDLCKLDLYNGCCEFVKIGSASSYIKREHLVDRISAGNLPLGIFNRPDMEIVSRRLLDGDYIVIVSDGVLDALSQGIGEDMMSELIGGTDLKNPNEIANALLNFCIHQSRGRIRDDMTVIVIGIWEKEGH
ncbi:MAG: SpoIIE family protein phosphatase [Lachnospiraceae bacterium]|nr:SpoIIE family protein phosphatase [Lachnospiraceae bacterium]